MLIILQCIISGTNTRDNERDRIGADLRTRSNYVLIKRYISVRLFYTGILKNSFIIDALYKINRQTTEVLISNTFYRTFDFIFSRLN